MTGDGSVQTKVYIFIVQPTGSAAAASLETVQYSAGLFWSSSVSDAYDNAAIKLVSEINTCRNQEQFLRNSNFPQP